MDTPKIVIFKDVFENVCPKIHWNNTFLCQQLSFRLAYVYLQCLGIKKYQSIHYNYSAIESSKLQQSNIHPFLLVLDHLLLNGSFATTPPLISKYSFFTLDPSTYNKDMMRNATPELLLHPLPPAIWLIFASLFIAHFILLAISIMFRLKFSYRLLGFISVGIFGILSTIYGSNLKAIISVNYDKLPFSNIEELTKLVAEKKLTLVNENFNRTFVWLVLSGEIHINNEYPKSLEKLYNATHHNPSLEILNFEELCQKLGNDPTLVYVGRESEIEQNCHQYCFASVDIPDFPLVLRSLSDQSTIHIVKK